MLRLLRILVVLGFCAARFVLAQADKQTTGTADPVYLLRLERAQRMESVCVLLTGNGQYHLERQTSQKTRIFESTLPAEELRDLVRVLSGDRLFKLEQKEIPDLMLKADDDQLMLEIHRPGVWQTLHFPDSASREPFRDALDPLLKWLDTINKRKVKELTEEVGRNNCLPPSKPEFSQRGKVPSQASPPNLAPAAGVTSAQPETYVLQMFDNRVVNYRTEVTCLLVSNTGAYHLVKQSSDYRKGLSNSVLDGTFQAPQMSSLRALLDAPELLNQPEEQQGSEEVILTSNSYVTHLTIPRPAKVQKVAAWKSYRIINHVLSRSIEDHGTKLVMPLREWLKANLNENAAVPTATPANPRCAPGT